MIPMDEKQSERRTRFVSLRVELLLGFTLLFTIVFGGTYYWFYKFATDRAMRQIEEALCNSLEATVVGVDADELATLSKEGVPNEEGFSDDPRYRRQMEWLQTVHQIEPRAWPYTYVKGDKPNEVIVIADLWARYDPEKAGKFLERYEPQDSLICYGLTDMTVDNKVHTDPWGSWLSAYAPITNSKGEKVGAAGVDVVADYVFAVQRSIREGVLTAFVVTCPMLLILAFLISEALSRPITILTRAAQRIGEGDYEQDLSHLHRGRFRNEISTLAEVFEIMVGKINKREETLRRQVEGLRIEIDEVKRKKQGGDI
jgi:HAMP domain-containing protein